MRFTLDTNCIIDVEESRPSAHFVRALVELHGTNETNIAVSAIGASERQRSGGYAKTFSEFRDKLTAAGFGEVELLAPLAYWGICFWEHCVWADQSDKLERCIHEILFPKIEFGWVEFAHARGLPLEALDKTWRNAKCDVLGLWCHIKHGGGVFVTSDKNFHAKTKASPLRDLGVGSINYPNGALNLAKGAHVAI